MLKAAGAIDDEELLTFRKLDSRLEGHPTPRIPPTDVATGSLGQGLPIGVGVAIAGKPLDRLPYRVWVLCGDSEMAEGSMWEAFQHAGWEGLDNLTAIIDVNRLGQTRETMLGWDLDGYVRRIEAFGWNAIAIDGHDVDAIEAAYAEAETTGQADRDRRPDQEGQGRQGGRGPARQARQAARRPRGGDRGARRRARPRRSTSPSPPTARRAARLRRRPAASCRPGSSARRSRPARPTASRSPRSARSRGDVVALDGEVSNSTHSEDFREAHPDRYFEMFIAEQQLVAAAVGMQVRGWTPFASTFAAFLSRAYDFVRMAAISRASIALSGSHAGVSIGEDGPSQMALEDIASFRAIHGSTVLHPSDANQTAKLVAAMADREGISFLRTLRGKTPVRTPADEDVHDRRQPRRRTRATTSRSSPAASPSTRRSRPPSSSRARASSARVLDAYSIKPIDAEAVRAAARECGAIVTVEDHWPEGGLGDAVLEALAEGDDRAARGQARRARDADVGHARRAAARGARSTPTRSPTRPSSSRRPAARPSPLCPGRWPAEVGQRTRDPDEVAWA